MSKLDRINQLQRMIIVHSILYYKMNENIVSDHVFDSWCNELVGLKKNFNFLRSIFYEQFKDFTGETATHIAYDFDKDPYWRGLATYLYRIHNNKS